MDRFGHWLERRRHATAEEASTAAVKPTRRRRSRRGSFRRAPTRSSVENLMRMPSSSGFTRSQRQCRDVGVAPMTRQNRQQHGANENAPVYLLPAPLQYTASACDPTAYMDNEVTPNGALRIGIAHGSVQGFGSDGEASNYISPTRAETAGTCLHGFG
jgi:hypothetical protein